VVDAGKIGVLIGVEAVLEELLHLAGAETGRGQADVVDHQQGNRFAVRARIEVRRGAVVIPIPWNQPVARSNCMGQILKRRNRRSVCPAANTVACE
jgi:hypothetical protein